MNQNRRYVRHLVTPRLYVSMNGSSAGGILYDVSLGGLALDVVGPRPAGERILLDFDMSETGEHFEGTGRIIWKSESGSRVGIQFIDLPERSHLKIKSWLSAKSISADPLQNVVVQDRSDITFMEYPTWLRERANSPVTPAVLQPPENEKPSVSGSANRLPVGTKPITAPAIEQSNAKSSESEDSAFSDLRAVFSQRLPAEPELDYSVAPEKDPQDWKQIRQWMLTAAAILLAVLLLAAGIKISTSPEFNGGATYQAIKSMLGGGVAKVLNSSAPPHAAQYSISNANPQPSKETKAPGSAGTAPKIGSGPKEGVPPNDQFEVMDGQHGRRYLPRTSTNLIVQFEKPHYVDSTNGSANDGAKSNFPPVANSTGPASDSHSGANATDQAMPYANSSRFGRVLRESSGELPITETMPEYPMFALQKNVQGRVFLTAIIKKDGTLDDVRILSSPSVLDSTVLGAVRTWRYQPHYKNGEPVEVVTEIVVDFSITTR